MSAQCTVQHTVTVRRARVLALDHAYETGCMAGVYHIARARLRTRRVSRPGVRVCACAQNVYGRVFMHAWFQGLPRPSGWIHGPELWSVDRIVDMMIMTLHPGPRVVNNLKSDEL